MGHHRTPFEEHVKILGFSLNRQEARLLGRKDAQCKEGLVERREDLPEAKTCRGE